MKERILCVFAHPDDEYSVAGLILKAKRSGYPVHLVCTTRGEAGGIRNEKQELLNTMSKAEIRTDEYHEANKLLDTNGYYFLDQGDNDASEWDVDYINKSLDRIIYETKATTLITFSSDGISGHPDHKKISEIVKKYNNDLNVVEVTKFNRNFLGKKLWFLPKKYKNKILTSSLVSTNEDTEVYKLPREDIRIKLQLLKIYRSQFPDSNGKYFKQTLLVIKFFSKYETYNDFYGDKIKSMISGWKNERTIL